MNRKRLGAGPGVCRHLAVTAALTAALAIAGAARAQAADFQANFLRDETRLLFDTGRAEPAAVNLRAARYGERGATRALRPAGPQFTPRGTEYRRGILTEWYRWRAGGLEQGFTLHASPGNAQRTAPERLELEIAVSGDLRPSPAPADGEIALVDNDGTPVARYGRPSAWDASGRDLPVRAAVRAAGRRAWIVLDIESAGARFPVTVDPVIVTVRKKLVASDAAPGDEFGFSVSTDGDRVVVGALTADAMGQDSGAAYLFERDAGGADNWGQVKKLVALDGAPGDKFGQGDIDGDTMAVGARADDDRGPQSGAVYLFERNAGGADNWGQVLKLTASGAGARDSCTTTDLSGDIVVMPCVAHDGAGRDAGATWLFERDPAGMDDWKEIAKLTASDASPGDRFGGGGFHEDTLFVAARAGDGLAVDSGAVYRFMRDAGGPGNWGEVGKLVADDGETGDSFGSRAAFAGDLLAVSAPEEDEAGEDAGAAYLFEREAGGTRVWRQVKKLVADDGEAGDNLARGLALLDADTVIAAAPFDDDAGQDAGAVYVFRRDECGPGRWAQAAKFVPADTAAGDWFGRQMDAAGGTLAVGAWRDDDGGENSGSVYLLDVSEPLDTDGDGVLDDRDNCSELSNTDQRDSNEDGYGNLCDADLNDDGRVTFADLQLVRVALGGTDPDADLNGNGIVDILDVLRVRANLSTRPGPSGIVSCAALP